MKTVTMVFSQSFIHSLNAKVYPLNKPVSQDPERLEAELAQA